MTYKTYIQIIIPRNLSGYFLNFNASLLCGLSPIKLAGKKHREFCSSDPRQLRMYLLAKEQYIKICTNMGAQVNFYKLARSQTVNNKNYCAAIHRLQQHCPHLPETIPDDPLIILAKYCEAVSILTTRPETGSSKIPK